MTEFDLLSRLGVALAIGLLVGLERGWRARDKADGLRTAGLRTFALAGLLGGVAGALAHGAGNLVFLGLAFLGFAITFTAFHLLESTEEGSRSVTGVVAGLLVFLTGAYALIGDLRVAVAVAVAGTLLLALRDPLHEWLRHLRWEEIRAILILAAMSFLALPILPNRPVDPWGVLNPAEIWLLAIAVAGISFGGYVAMRLMGERRGIVVAALAGGLASSTATSLTLARLAVGQPAAAPLLAAGILLSGAVMMVRVVLVAGLLNIELVPALAGAVLAALAVKGVAVLVLIRGRATNQSRPTPTLILANPLELATALKLALFIVVVLVGAELVRRHLGEVGLMAAAAVSGVADVDAITIAMARMSTNPASLSLAAICIALAVAVNTLSKATMAMVVGGPHLGLLVLGPSLLSLLAGTALFVLC